MVALIWGEVVDEDRISNQADRRPFAPQTTADKLDVLE
jgi:hypothetical protein